MKNNINLILQPYQPLQRVRIGGKRYYRVGDKAYPSVTTVLSSIKKQSLENWRAWVGEEKANNITNSAAVHGTALHSLAEAFILNNTNFKSENPFAVKRFKPIKRILETKISNVYGVEPNLYSDKLGVAGSIDLVAEYEGVLSIIDFKTARKKRTSKDIKSYFMQAAIYAAFVYERWGIVPKQIVIIMSCEDQEERPLIFKEPITPWLNQAVDIIDKSEYSVENLNEIEYELENE